MVKCIFCGSSKDIILAVKHYNKRSAKQRYKYNKHKSRSVHNDGFWEDEIYSNLT